MVIGNLLVSRRTEVNTGTVVIHPAREVLGREGPANGIPHRLAEITIDDDVYLNVPIPCGEIWKLRWVLAGRELGFGRIRRQCQQTADDTKEGHAEPA